MKERLRFSALDKFVPDRHTQRRTDRQSDSLVSLTEPKIHRFMDSAGEDEFSAWIYLNVILINGILIDEFS